MGASAPILLSNILVDAYGFTTTITWIALGVNEISSSKLIPSFAV